MPPQRRRRSVPIAYGDRLVVPDALATTIKLTSSATRRRPLAWRRRDMVNGTGAVAHIYRGPAVVTCLEICCSLSLLLVSGSAPSGYSRPGPGCPATQCERGRGPLALAGTPNADYGRASNWRTVDPTDARSSCYGRARRRDGPAYRNTEKVADRPQPVAAATSANASSPDWKCW